MERSSGSSFLPKSPIKNVGGTKPRKVFVLSYISYALFFGTVVAAGLAYGYLWYSNNQLMTERERLQAEQQRFNQADMDRISNLHDRIEAASMLVNDHASVVAVLESLENSVADPVYYTRFLYDRTNLAAAPVLALTAQAREFNTVLFQQEVLRAATTINQFSLTDTTFETVIEDEFFATTPEPIVTFELNAALDLSAINYRGAAPEPQAELFDDVGDDVLDEVIQFELSDEDFAEDSAGSESTLFETTEVESNETP